MKKIVHVSDTHYSHTYLKIPDGDLLVHTGDGLGYGSIRELSHMANWLNSLPHKYKIYIPGNHDKIFETDPALAKATLGDKIILLMDEGCEIFGKKIWGSPFTPLFGRWSFMLPRGPVIAEKWEKIPDDTDILLTHGPPYGILDEVLVGRDPHAGCEELLKRVKEIKPELHLFGHIHEGFGQVHQDGTSFYNSAIMDETYRPVNHAQVIDLIVEE